MLWIGQAYKEIRSAACISDRCQEARRSDMLCRLAWVVWSVDCLCQNGSGDFLNIGDDVVKVSENIENLRSNLRMRLLEKMLS